MMYFFQNAFSKAGRVVFLERSCDGNGEDRDDPKGPQVRRQ